MKRTFDFTFEKAKEEPAEAHRFGSTQVTPFIFLGGEEDVSDIVHEVDVWIDFRHETPWNRLVAVPDHVTYIRIPFQDGDDQRANGAFLQTKGIADLNLKEGKSLCISCHAGVSRSATLVWWLLAEKLGDAELAWRLLKQMRPHIEPHEAFFPFIQSHILRIKKEPYM